MEELTIGDEGHKWLSIKLYQELFGSFVQIGDRCTNCGLARARRKTVMGVRLPKYWWPEEMKRNNTYEVYEYPDVPICKKPKWLKEDCLGKSTRYG